MRKLCLLILFCMLSSFVQSSNTLVLSSPDLSRGKSLMQALSHRQSVRTFAARMLTQQDLSDLLWAANGVNRPESGKRTAPSALNRQDIHLYVCLQEGTYRYDATSHRLDQLNTQDLRLDTAPVSIFLVSEGDERMSSIDAGIVSQNISLFCSAANLATYPRASFDQANVAAALQLTGNQIPQLCHPVGYPES